MTELIAITDVSFDQFTEEYNKYSFSQGKVTAPSGRKVLGCEGYSFHPNTGTGVFVGKGKGSGFITLKVSLTEQERTTFS